MPRQPRSDRPDTPGRPDAYFALGFQFYLDGRHGTFCNQHQAAGYLFHLAVELMLKAILLEEVHREVTARVWAARGPLIEAQGPDTELDPQIADAILEPYRNRAEQLEHDYGHSVDRLWRDGIVRLGKPELARFTPLITKISHWEKFRYPVFVHGRSNVSGLTSVKGARVRSHGRDLVNRSDVNRGEVDELVAALIQAARYSPYWVRQRAATEIGLDTYRRENHHLIPGVFEGT